MNDIYLEGPCISVTFLFFNEQNSRKFPGVKGIKSFSISLLHVKNGGSMKINFRSNSTSLSGTMFKHSHCCTI